MTKDLNFDNEIALLLLDRAKTMLDFTPDHHPLNMYAIYRADLEMPAGKLAAQCGHAYLNAYAAAALARPDITSAYKGTGNGTKICMYTKNLGQLLRAYKEALAVNIPCSLIIDRGHIMAPHFDGQPIITAIGIGPAYRSEIAHITKRCTLAY